MRRELTRLPQDNQAKPSRRGQRGPFSARRRRVNRQQHSFCPVFPLIPRYVAFVYRPQAPNKRKGDVKRAYQVDWPPDAAMLRRDASAASSLGSSYVKPLNGFKEPGESPAEPIFDVAWMLAVI